jgi:hypothetical protein
VTGDGADLADAHDGDEPLQAARVIAVTVGQDKRLHLAQIHIEGVGTVRRPVFREPEIEQECPGPAFPCRPDEGRKAVFGQDGVADLPSRTYLALRTISLSSMAVISMQLSWRERISTRSSSLRSIAGFPPQALGKNSPLLFNTFCPKRYPIFARNPERAACRLPEGFFRAVKSGLTGPGNPVINFACNGRKCIP